MKLSRSDRTRRAVSAVMTSFTAICTIAAVGVLALILSYIASRGIKSLSLHFLVETPQPVGEGGGIGNAILGSAVLLGLACVAGIPLGIGAGVYLSYFFFQAEDGIRDLIMTGVQTCALPIFNEPVYPKISSCMHHILPPLTGC